MHDEDSPSRARRRLLHGLAAAPALLALPRFGLSQTVAEAAFDEAPVTANQVLNVSDFEALARAKLPPAHFGYVATGADDDRTVFLNHDAYSHIEIRSRRFADVSKLDTSRRILGSVWQQPFYFSAVSSMRAFHPEAEIAVARAAASGQVQMMLSTGSSSAVEDVIAARNAPVWQQLYATDDWQVTEAIVRRAEKAFSPSTVLRGGTTKHCCAPCGAIAGIAHNVTSGGRTICGAKPPCLRASTCLRSRNSRR
jgi:4-hydroxymandelate oxidase